MGKKHHSHHEITKAPQTALIPQAEYIRDLAEVTEAQVEAPVVCAVEIPEPIPQKIVKAWRVLKEKMVVIHGGTTYVSPGKIIRDHSIYLKLQQQQVELEPYPEIEVV